MTADFAPGIVIPLHPFFGSLGVAPAPELGHLIPLQASPSVVFSPLGSAKDPDEERWRTLLGSFIQIHRDVWPASNPPADAAKPHRSFLTKIPHLIGRRRRKIPTSAAAPGTASTGPSPPPWPPAPP